MLQYLEGKKPDFRDVKLQRSAEKALKQIHKSGVSHGDIRLANMINHKGQVYLIDFGFSSSVIDNTGSEAGTDYDADETRSLHLNSMRKDDYKLKILLPNHS